MLFKVFGAFIATFAFCFIWIVPKRFIFPAALVGSFGCFVYLILCGADFSHATATFIAGCAISFCAQILARMLKTPVTVFVIPGIIPLVPGTGMYNIVASMIGSSALPYSTSYYITDTLGIAGMIAVSIVVMDSLFKLIPIKRI